MMKSKFRDNYNYYLVFLGALTVLPMVAPILAKLGESISIFTIPAKVIYFVYSFTCHQFDHRSLHLFDYQYAWCGRETGLFLSFFVVSILVKYFKIKRISWYWVLPFMLGWLLDGGVQTIATFIVGLNGTASLNDPIYISSNLTRFMSGALFGIGLALFISTFMYNGFNEGRADTRRNLVDTKSRIVKLLLGNKYKVVITCLVMMLTIYTSLAGLWQLTSVKYLPSDLWDTIVRTPTSDFYTRRGHALCPTNTEDLFNISCFFK